MNGSKYSGLEIILIVFAMAAILIGLGKILLILNREDKEESPKKVHVDNPINTTTCRRVRCPENDFDDSLNKKLQECEARNKALEKTLEDVVDDRFEDEDSEEWS